MNFIRNTLCVFMLLIACTLSSIAEQLPTASANFSITLPDFISITPMTSPVLTAHITDKTGNLYAPLSAGFRVISNRSGKTTLYLKANAITDSGYEEAMFTQGNRVYIAFTNVAKIPSHSSFINCKTGAIPKSSPGVVAYPVLSVTGAENKYLKSKNKYEVTVNNGTSYVNVNIGSNVLNSSFASNDPRGFYQAVLSLTEVDM